jgi:hypothetical protein
MTVFNFGDNLVTSMEALEQLYAAPGWAALAKETDRIRHCEGRAPCMGAQGMVSEPDLRSHSED